MICAIFDSGRIINTAVRYSHFGPIFDVHCRLRRYSIRTCVQPSTLITVFDDSFGLRSRPSTAGKSYRYGDFQGIQFCPQWRSIGIDGVIDGGIDFYVEFEIEDGIFAGMDCDIDYENEPDIEFNIDHDIDHEIELQFDLLIDF